MNWKLIVFYVVCTPIALAWDLLFSGVTYLQKGMVWVDNKGENWMQSMKDWAESP